MKTECFTNYTSEDFILDKDFRELVQNPEKAEELQDLIESFPEKRYEINLAIKVIRGLHVTKFQQTNSRKNELWQQIVAKPKIRVQLTFIKYAAAILILLGTGSLFYFFNLQKSELEIGISDNESFDNIQTSPKNAQLVLANGKTVTITNKESTVQYSNDGSKIKVNDSEDIALNAKDAGVNKMIVPYGKRSTITLSDGTTVSLNSGSTLIFPSAFTGKSREVQLIGEGFFDVTHNKEKPFFVKTDGFKMKVYGTKFDIQSYKQDNASSLILVEGKVSMISTTGNNTKEVFLTPNQRAIVVDGSSNIQIDNIENVEEYTSWTEGYLSFSDEEIAHLLKKISRYYDIDIEIIKLKNTEKIYGKLDLKDDIEKVLDGVSFISNTKYRKVGNRYEFYQ